jgi:hypothetical protein
VVTVRDVGRDQEVPALRHLSQRLEYYTPIKQPRRGQVLAPDNQAYNLRSRRAIGERGFALLTGRWRALQHTTASPSKISDFAQAALVLTHSNTATCRQVAEINSLTRRGRHRTLVDLLRQVNPVLRGRCNYFKHGVSKRTFSYVDHFAWWRIVGWLRKRHLGLNWGTLVRRFRPGWQINDGPVAMFRPATVTVSRYRYRGTRVPTPWASTQPEPTATSA